MSSMQPFDQWSQLSGTTGTTYGPPANLANNVRWAHDSVPSMAPYGPNSDARSGLYDYEVFDPSTGTHRQSVFVPRSDQTSQTPYYSSQPQSSQATSSQRPMSWLRNPLSKAANLFRGSGSSQQPTTVQPSSFQPHHVIPGPAPSSVPPSGGSVAPHSTQSTDGFVTPSQRTGNSQYTQPLPPNSHTYSDSRPTHQTFSQVPTISSNQPTTGRYASGLSTNPSDTGRYPSSRRGLTESQLLSADVTDGAVQGDGFRARTVGNKDVAVDVDTRGFSEAKTFRVFNGTSELVIVVEPTIGPNQLGYKGPHFRGDTTRGTAPSSNVQGPPMSLKDSLIADLSSIFITDRVRPDQLWWWGPEGQGHKKADYLRHVTSELPNPGSDDEAAEITLEQKLREESTKFDQWTIDWINQKMTGNPQTQPNTQTTYGGVPRDFNALEVLKEDRFKPLVQEIASKAKAYQSDALSRDVEPDRLNWDEWRYLRTRTGGNVTTQLTAEEAGFFKDVYERLNTEFNSTYHRNDKDPSINNRVNTMLRSATEAYFTEQNEIGNDSFRSALRDINDTFYTRQEYDQLRSPLLYGSKPDTKR